jgi:hypothetical protein
MSPHFYLRAFVLRENNNGMTSSSCRYKFQGSHIGEIISPVLDFMTEPSPKDWHDCRKKKINLRSPEGVKLFRFDSFLILIK